MNTFVVYDSQFGNTKRIAQAIANTLRAFGQTRAICVDSTQAVDFQGVDLLILGCPTQGWRPTPAMQSFLVDVSPKSLSGLAVACFDTRFRWPLWIAGSAAQRMVRQLRTMGVEPLVLPESFFVKGKQGPLVDGEMERAVQWALGIHHRCEAPQPHLSAR
jgi:flavodoxin